MTTIGTTGNLRQIYEGKCLNYVDWLTETRPSFSPPRRDLRLPDEDPGAAEVYSLRLDVLNTKFEKLLEQLTQRLRASIELNGDADLVSNVIIGAKSFIEWK